MLQTRKIGGTGKFFLATMFGAVCYGDGNDDGICEC